MSGSRCLPRPPTSLSVAQPPPLNYARGDTPHYQTKKSILFCLFTMEFLSIARWVFPLTIPHGMHLVVLTHFSLFWVVCHPSRTFPPKEFEQEPLNRLPVLPTLRSYLLLPLTHDPPLLYWLGIGWRCLGLVRAPFSCVSKACLLLMRLPWSKGSSMHSTAHSWPLMVWTIFWPSIFMACFLQGLGLAWLWALLSLAHSLLLLWSY